MRSVLHPNQLRPGDRVRDYRIVRRLGAGGFSRVFLAEREGIQYALKVALRPVSSEDEDQVDGWLRREVASLDYLIHPNLLPVHEWGRWPDPRTGYSFYVTEYIPGVTFREWCHREQVPPSRWVDVLCEVLLPLQAMHERGMFHRDFKADNVLVRDGDARPFLIDLGAVHLPHSRPLTEGIAPGTMYCQPPEAIRFVVSPQALEKGARFEAQPSADLYAVGVLLYETLTGHYPFDPKLPVEQLLAAILSVSPTEPRQLNPEAPESLCALALRLLAKDPEQRPSSASALCEELRRLRAEEGETAAWRTPGRAFSGPVSEREETAFVPCEVLGSSVSRWVPPRGMRVFLVLMVGMGLLGWGGWLLLHAGGEVCPRVDPTADPGAQPVPVHFFHPSRSPAATPVEPSSRLCSLPRAVLGATLFQLLGCATAPAVRPDSLGYLLRCPPEVRETSRKLNFVPVYLYGAYIQPGPSVSSVSRRRPLTEGGALNVKPGPITAHAYPYNSMDYLVIAGHATTTRMRVYIEFDRIQLKDGSWLPLCGAAVSTAEDVFGIPTREGFAWPDTLVEPALVDHSPGSVLLNDPQFTLVVEPPNRMQRRDDIEQVDPEAKPDMQLANPR